MRASFDRQRADRERASSQLAIPRRLKKIDIKGCPENFRTAWAGYIVAWERKRNQEQATEDTLDAISMWKGEFADLPATVRCMEAYDTVEAWQNCERVAVEFGIDVSKLNVR